MSLSILLLWLVSIPLAVHSLPDLRGLQLNCGASEDITHGNLKYIPDKGFISVGNKSAIKTEDVLPVLSTLRFFPDTSAKKYCYVLPVIKGGKYLVRTTYFYGGYDGGKEPPVFDQIVQGTKWSTVNTTEDYANGMSSYYEIILASSAKSLSVCLARNEHTTSSPFISALEIEHLENSVYNSTDFSKTLLLNATTTLLLQSFGTFPPQKAFSSAITTSRGKTITIQWPPVSLPSTKYYIALYFQDNRTPSPYSWRVFSVSINGQNFYKDINVTANGVTVYGSEWPLSGRTEITLTPGNTIPVGPVINAGEIYQIFPLGGRTLTRDVMAMEDLARRFVNPPSDWSGDPCLPPENSWTGVKCSQDKLARVVALNLTSMGISGPVPSSLANLTAVTQIWLGGNKLTGSIPNLSTLKGLQTLHLGNNKLEGTIPQSLGQLEQLRELFLQNNNLDGRIPDSLRNKKGLKIQVSPGNHQSS
ncbi:hypothetical protein OIU77_028837 [Salix suchowensis]|uniref:Malectin-like domain-containing protein n=1 Tax=Salix suchowensis TaxID=1278906 RepID=A0ABQ9BMJ4_9ROSI|nr:hypothetical protein OIU77_028837 [Salix suchowensis]